MLITRAPGYMLRVEPDELDADRFERLLGDGRAAAKAPDPATAAATLRQALDVWRGPALADFAYDPFAQAEIARLEELRLEALEDRIEADLALGGAADLVGELEALISNNPLRERLPGQLMLALYRAGRQADALEVFNATRTALDEELGLAPSPQLQRLQAAILRQEPALEVSIETTTRRQAPEPDAAASEVRKTVTVMMARRPSVRGLDPEALSHEDKLYSAHLTRTVERYGGRIASSLGDEVMAVFGVPHAHEDDAFRAVSAAFEIRDSPVADAIASGTEPRVGIATGEVLASGSGAGVLSVIGDPVTAAGELKDAAAAGEILIGENTARLIRGSAEGEPVETEAGRAWRVLELRRGRPAVGSLKAPLVGRSAELGRLREAFARVRSDGALHLFTILGTAGIGKSRLAQEFAAEAAEQATVAIGRCVPYGEGITFWSLREIVAELTAGGRAGESLTEGHEARRLAESLLEGIGGSETSLEREEIFWATRSLFATLARARPLLVFFEDVHWAEPTFLDLVEYLAERTRGAPIMLVCIARPELLEQRAGMEPREGERELASARTASRYGLRGADRQSRPRPRPGDDRPCARDRRGQPAVHRAAGRDARGGGSPRSGALDPADDRCAAVGTPGPAGARRAGGDLPRRHRRQGVLRRGHARSAARERPRLRHSSPARPWSARSSSDPLPLPGPAPAFASVTSSSSRRPTGRLRRARANRRASRGTRRTCARAPSRRT